MALTLGRDDEVIQKVDETWARLERLERQFAPLLELKEDAQPILKELMHAVILELDELDGHFKLEDALLLIKRLLRNTKNLSALLDRLEQANDLISDMTPIIHEVTKATISELGELEKQGIFKNLAAIRTVAERFSRRYTPERVVALGDKLIELLQLVDLIAQPRTLRLAHAATDAISQDDQGRAEVTMFGLWRKMRDPDTLRGLALMLDLAKALGQADNTKSVPMLESGK
ncbi:MAG TPA: DUF1641 domain-containing protein [Polyangiaceae bacterium]|jgi:uncharacterized protein YjgD (DUF1641 family)|nr:MAG: hypothetical protein BWY17_00130 [Deltaproteobacteria bacterium ADurb.Bin207]HNS96593.1 DUF1641 domain-containing protein [Polyangiaceae bacterium]HNZ20496.1 DUF1641 domain-containing protein [Polyangiaceae bacterium]HOD22979.1 DUF1641 domain-containing protein [Polyangiaceae bacterium]HOE49818.1 DUF1641 domain-containing protein [Polyangiaceae bacterium]